MAKEGKIGSAIEMSGEQAYKAACKEISDNLRVLGSEMKVVTAEFGANATGTEALTKKQDVLKKQLDEQNKKVVEAEKALALMRSEAEGKTTPAIQKMETELNNAKAAMTKTKNEIESTEKTLKQAGITWADVGDTVAWFGKAITASMAAVGAAATAVGAALYDMGTKAAAAGDKIDKQSQKLGLSTESYQEWDYILRQSGASIDSLGVGMKTLQSTLAGLTEDGGKSSEAFAAIGINFDDIKNKSPEEAFAMTVEALQQMPEGADKTAAALKLLGKQGMELMPLLNSTAAETEALKQRAHTLGMVMSAESVNAAVEFTDRLTDLKGSFTGIKNSIGADLLPGFSMITDGLTNLLVGEEGAGDAIVKGVEVLVSSIGEAIPRVVGIISNIASTIADIAPSVITALVDGIVSNLPMLIDAALKLVMTLVQGILQAIPRLLEGAIAIITGLAEGIAEALPTLLPAIVGVITQVVRILIDNIPMLINAALKLIQGLVKGLLAAIPVLVAAIPEIINSLINAILTSIPLIMSAGMELLLSLVAALPSIVVSIVQAIPVIINGIINAVMTSIPLIIQAGIDLITSLVGALPQIITEIVAVMPVIISALIKAATEMLPQMMIMGLTLNIEMIQGLIKAIPELVKAIPQIIKALVDALIKGVPEMLKMGGDLIKGLWEGILNVKNWIMDKIKGFMDGIIGGIKSFFGIHSPATTTMLIGNDLAEGLVVGFEDEADNVISRMEDAMDLEDIDFGGIGSVSDAIQDELEMLAADDMFEDIGKAMARGLSLGFTNELRLVEHSIRQATEAIVPVRIGMSGGFSGNAGGGAISVTQNIYASDTSYAGQQREAAKQLRMIAREVM